MKMEYVTVRTKDLPGSIAFYEKILGFKVSRRFSPRPGMEIAFLSDGSGGQVEFIQGDGEPAFSGKGISLGFRVEDIEKTAGTLKREGVEIVLGPLTMPNGVRLLGARDPNGLDLGFMQEA
jgi:lactoylglutathione lyase